MMYNAPKCGLLFPGCGIRYLGNEMQLITSCEYDVTTLVKQIRQICPFDSNYLHGGDNYEDDELQEQLSTYLLSCAMADVLNKQEITISCSIGYSMGIYAALYNANAISFIDGVHLIVHAFNSIRNNLRGRNYGVIAVIGLTLEALQKIMYQNDFCVEIINQNNEISYVVAGPQNEILTISEILVNEGALRVVKLPITVPYHSSFARQAQEEFKKVFSEIRIGKVKNPVISCIDQATIQTRDDIKNTLIRNIGYPINFYMTIKKALETGTNDFIECGPGESLAKSCKLMDYTLTMQKVSAIIDRDLKVPSVA